MARSDRQSIVRLIGSNRNSGSEDVSCHKHIIHADYMEPLFQVEN